VARGNKGFADLVAAGNAARSASARLPPRTGVLGARENRLADLATGALVNRLQEFVDPARCKIWDGHNRDYQALTADVCADLIESFRAQGKQEVAAIVRRVTGDLDHDYEVICGARRHWTVSWLRANNYPEFRFLVEPRELTDEEAFRLADLENRSRKDLSDYERATDYARAIDRYYGGSQQKMVERLEVSKSWLSRYLELARLPAEILGSFGSPHVIRITHAAALAPLLRVPPMRERMIAAAALLAHQQAASAGEGRSPVLAASVVRSLVQAAEQKPGRRVSKEIVIREPGGAILARGQGGRGGLVSLTLPNVPSRDRAEVMKTVAALLDQVLSKAG
jgi:ParB family transcriptional regulator, chromosome partitioning protein